MKWTPDCKTFPLTPIYLHLQSTSSLTEMDLPFCSSARTQAHASQPWHMSLTHHSQDRDTSSALTCLHTATGHHLMSTGRQCVVAEHSSLGSCRGTRCQNPLAVLCRVQPFQNAVRAFWQNEKQKTTSPQIQPKNQENTLTTFFSFQKCNWASITGLLVYAVTHATRLDTLSLCMSYIHPATRLKLAVSTPPWPL